MAKAQIILGEGSGSDMSWVFGKTIASDISLGTTARVIGIIKGLNTIAVTFNTGSAATVTVYGYVGDTRTQITTLSKSANPQNVTVTGYERLEMAANNTASIYVVAVN